MHKIILATVLSTLALNGWASNLEFSTEEVSPCQSPNQKYSEVLSCQDDAGRTACLGLNPKGKDKFKATLFLGDTSLRITVRNEENVLRGTGKKSHVGASGIGMSLDPSQYFLDGDGIGTKALSVLTVPAITVIQGAVDVAFLPFLLVNAFGNTETTRFTLSFDRTTQKLEYTLTEDKIEMSAGREPLSCQPFDQNQSAK